MNRLFGSGILAAVLLLVPALAGPAVAAPAASPSPTAAPTITARGDHVFLSGDPWSPSGTLVVNVWNSGSSAAQGFFLLRLPASADLTSGGNCQPVRDMLRTWRCGGAELPAGTNRLYPLTVTSSPPEPVFGLQEWGSVAGQDAAWVTEQFFEFRINWPDPASLVLRPTADPVVDGRTTVRMRVTNTGTFDIGGYSLAVTTPAGVRVTAPACSNSGRMAGQGCEIVRPSVLADGATDSFDVRLTVTGGAKTVHLALTPASRYTNKDTAFTLRLTGPDGSGAGTATTPQPTRPAATPSPTAAPSPTVTPSETATPSPAAPTVTPSPSIPDAAHLPRTGASVGTYAVAAAVLLAVGVGLLVRWRRRMVGH